MVRPLSQNIPRALNEESFELFTILNTNALDQRVSECTKNVFKNLEQTQNGAHGHIITNPCDEDEPDCEVCGEGCEYPSCDTDTCSTDFPEPCGHDL